jgi:hypothetical protein
MSMIWPWLVTRAMLRPLRDQEVVHLGHQMIEGRRGERVHQIAVEVGVGSASVQVDGLGG